MPIDKALELATAQQAVADDFVDQYLSGCERSPDDPHHTRLRLAVGHLIAEVMLTTLKNAPR
jgi:hypothetical protein